MKRYSVFYFFASLFVLPPVYGQIGDGFGAHWQRLKEIRETQRENKEAVVSETSLGAKDENMQPDVFAGRDMLVYVPSVLPEKGQRALLVVLHGGGGNANFMREHLKIDGVAEQNHFIVAYLNGSAASTIGGRQLKAWNAGSGCCGKPYTDNVDDVGYISNAVTYLQNKYGVSSERIFGAGHSNGAMMMQTMVCQTNLFTKVATLAGTLMSGLSTCPAAHGHTIYNYHGADDQNVPIAGGFGTKGVTNINFTAQTEAKSRFENAGGHYFLTALPGADHTIEHLNVASQQQDGMTIAERIAKVLGLTLTQ